MATRQSARTRPRAAGTDDGAHDPALPQKKRARHRLIGAIALCLLAAIVVPLLLESEPTRPVADVSVVIPPRETPLPARSADPKPADAATPESRSAEGDARTAEAKAADARVAAAKGADPKSADAKTADPKAAAAKGTDSKGTDAKSADAKGADAKGADAKGADAKGADAKGIDPRSAEAKATEAKTADAKAAEAKAAEAKAAEAKAKAAASKAAKPDARATDKPDEIALLAETAQARARGETVGRYVLQVGAFSGDGGAAVAVDRVQALGLPAFTERIRTDRGERIRVRVGPFVSRESADQARVKLKAAGVEAALIAP